MNQSASSVQYFVQPPSVPEYMYKRYATSLEDLVDWAKQEHRRWLQKSAERGYWKTVKHLNEEYSPIRILAEMKGFRRVCALITDDVWRKLNRHDRDFIIAAYELRDMLLSH